MITHIPSVSRAWCSGCHDMAAGHDSAAPPAWGADVQYSSTRAAEQYSTPMPIGASIIWPLAIYLGTYLGVHTYLPTYTQGLLLLAMLLLASAALVALGQAAG